MKVYNEISLRDFEFWSGAVCRAEVFTDEQLDEIEVALEDLYPYGCSDTQINDLFRFEEDWLAELLGFDSFEELKRHNSEEEEEENEDENEE